MCATTCHRKSQETGSHSRYSGYGYPYYRRYGYGGYGYPYYRRRPGISLWFGKQTSCVVAPVARF